MSNLDGAAEIFEQRSLRGNERTKHGKFGWAIPPQIERASAARESTAIAKPAALIPADDDSQEMLIISEPVSSYNELIGVIRTRVGQLGVRYLDFDLLAGFADGLSGKIFGPAQIKRLGIEKMFDAIRASGMRIRIEHDPEQTAKMLARISEKYNPRQANQARPNNRSHMSNKMIGDVLSYLANRKGGLTQLRAAVKEARSNMARHGAKALWEKRRADGPVDFAIYLGNSQLRPPALRPPEEPGSSTNPCSTEAAA